MLPFYLRGAVRSLRRTPVLSSVMVVDLALGLAIFMMAFTAVDSHTRDPITRRADLFHVDWGTAPELDLESIESFQRVLAMVPHMLLSYADAERLAAHPAVARSARTFTSRLALGHDGKRIESAARFCTRELFAMFELRFQFGGPWSAAAERGGALEIVLDHTTNQRLFGGRNSVGKALLIDGRAFQVVGVLAAARHRLRAYDFALVPGDAVYLPFEQFALLAARPDYVGPRSLHGPSTDALKHSADTFVQLWVELPTPERRDAYAAFLDAQAARLQPVPVARRPRLSTVAQFIADSIPIPNGFRVFEACAFIALLACCVNLSRLLIVKFQARAPELAVQRAFGATRGSVLAQYLIEVLLVALAATVLGLIIAHASLIGINAIFPDRPVEFALDPLRVAIACAAGLAAGLLAGFGPALRAGQSAPAAFLRLQ